MKLYDLNRKQKAYVLATLAFFLGYPPLLFFKPGDPETLNTIFSIGHLLPHIIAGVCTFRYFWKGRHSTPQRRFGWLLICLACFSYLSGDLIWAYYDEVLKVPVPYPGWDDAAWLAVFPLIISGILLLFGSIPRAGRARLLLDSAIAAGSIGILSWRFLAHELWTRSDLSLIGKLVAVAYPLGDIAVLFFALLLLSSQSANRMLRLSHALLACGVILWSFADTFYTYYRFNGGFELGSWFDWGWPFGSLLIGYASLLPRWSQSGDLPAEDASISRQAGFARGLLRLAAPYIAAGASLLIAASYDYVAGGTISNGVIFVGAGLLLLILFRQIFTLLENRELTTQLSTLNESLEHRVAQRTHQLGALLELTQAVSSTLQVDDVLNAALSHTREALETESVIIWLAPMMTDTGPLTPPLLHVGLESQPEIRAFLSRQFLHEQAELLPLPSRTPGSSESSGSCLRAPLLWQDRLLGMIGVLHSNDQVDSTDWELLRSIGLEVGTALENARQFHAAREAADKDPVTGLLNHRAIHQRLDNTLREARQDESPFAVVMLDMNNFKLFNDTYGHPVGDQVLKAVSQLLHETCRQADYVGRYGGDEFLLVLPETDKDGAIGIAQRIQERMQTQGYRFQDDERTVPVTFSFGIAVFPQDSANRHELLTVADSNLYAAKQTGESIRSTTEAQHENRRLRTDGSFDVLDAMITAVDNKDRYTRQHSEDVTEFALWTAEELGASEETMRIIRIGGLLHDVGKIGVPDEILRKPGRLTPEEYEVMKRHPRLGALIVSSVPGMENIVDAVRAHHERWDGQGYPDGTEGEETPFLGRLLAVADAFSAMTTDRPYRKGMDWETALHEIQANIGTQFDPEIAQAFLRAARQQMARRAASETETPLRLAA